MDLKKLFQEIHFLIISSPQNHVHVEAAIGPSGVEISQAISHMIFPWDHKKFTMLSPNWWSYTLW